MAVAILGVLSETEKLPGYRPLLRVVWRFVDAWEAAFWRDWQAPEPALLPSLIGHTFAADLDVERARADWRKAAGLPAERGRFLRGQWRKRIMALRSLDDDQKQRLASTLRAQAILEAEGRPARLAAIVSAIEPPAAATEVFRTEFARQFGAAMERAADGAAQSLGMGADWTLANPQAVRSLQSYAGYYGDRITKLVPLEWQSQIKKAVIAGLDEGQGIPEMGENIRALWENLRGFESERIARTEAVRARAEAKEEFYGALGIQELEWIVGPNPCPECAANAGRTFPVSQRGLQPAHPNCECDWVPTDADIDWLRGEALAGTGPMAAWPEMPEARYVQ